MEKIIYHGSDHIITQPRFGVGKPYNDYGVGFYCTEDPDMAKSGGWGWTGTVTPTDIASPATDCVFWN